MPRELRVSDDASRCCRKCEWWQWFTVREVVCAPGIALRGCAFNVQADAFVLASATTADEVCDAFSARDVPVAVATPPAALDADRCPHCGRGICVGCPLPTTPESTT